MDDFAAVEEVLGEGAGRLPPDAEDEEEELDEEEEDEEFEDEEDFE